MCSNKIQYVALRRYHVGIFIILKNSKRLPYRELQTDSWRHIALTSRPYIKSLKSDYHSSTLTLFPFSIVVPKTPRSDHVGVPWVSDIVILVRCFAFNFQSNEFGEISCIVEKFPSARCVKRTGWEVFARTVCQESAFSSVYFYRKRTKFSDLEGTLSAWSSNVRLS